MNKPELLCPAGDLERLQMALHFGADAVYLAGAQFGMRAGAENFTPDGIRAAVQLAHAQGAAVHVTCNTLPRDDEMAQLPAYLELLDDAGVDAIIAADADGAYTKYVGTKAVIMATGDFSHDKDMMERYCPQAVELCDFTTDINYDQGIWMGGLMPGDGHKMELWVGGAWQKEPNNIMLGRPNLPGDQPYTSHTGLMVDNMGQRFMNEDALGGLACATIMHLSEKTAYCIWGANRAEAGGPWGAINYPHGEYFTTEEVIERWDTDADGFGIVKADTREEVISKLGLPAATIDTVERYNKMCEAGVDTDFYKTADKLISIGADDGPFYGASFSPGFLTSLGGLRTDSDLRVLDENDQPIEGLFNAGCMIGNFYSGTYTFAMEGMNYGATCITLPYVLGKDLGSGKLN